MEVKELEFRAKDLEFYIYPMTSAKVNPNNDSVALHKSISYTCPNKSANQVQTTEPDL